MMSDKATSRRRWLWTLTLGAASVAGNLVPLSVGFSVEFIFGSVAGLLAVMLVGPASGVAVALIGASWTFVLWNHPWAILTFGCEALFVAIARRRRPGADLIVLDAVYWALVGVPLILAFYFGLMHLGLEVTGVLALKQSLNGVGNAAIASFLLDVLPLWEWAPGGARPVRKTERVLFGATAFLLFLVAVGGLISVNQRDLQRAQRDLAIRVRRAGAEVEWNVTRWLDQHRRAMELAAEKVREAGFRRTPLLEHQVEEIHQLFPDFIEVFVADGNATSLAFDPPTDGRGQSNVGIDVSDRVSMPRLRDTGRTHISDGLRRRGQAGETIATMVAPVLTARELVGLAGGTMNLERLEALVREVVDDSLFSVTIHDRTGAVVAATDRRQAGASRDLPGPAALAQGGVPGVRLSLPMATQNTSPTRNWRDAAYFTSLPLKDSGWTVRVEASLAPLQQSLYQSTMLNLAGIIVILAVGNAASLWISRRLARPIAELAQVSVGIPDKIEANDVIAWPTPETVESAELVSSLQATSVALGDKVRALAAYGRELEDAVAARTAELKATGERLALAVRSTGAGVWDWDVVNNQMHWDAGMFRLYGLDPGRVAGSIEDWRAALHPEDGARAMAECEAALAGEREFDTEFRIRRPDGSTVHLKADGLVLRDEAGKPIRMIGLNRDVTGSKRAEAALGESEMRLRRLYESGMFGALHFAVDGAVVEANDRFLAMVGYTREELKAGRIRWDRMTPPEHRQLDERAIAELQARGVSTPYEKEFLRKDGSRLPIIIGAATYGDARQDGIAFVLDITERRRAEEQLRQAGKMESIGNLAGGIAHDFNNVLTVVLSAVDAAWRDLKEGKAVEEEDLLDIRGAAVKAANLTRQLLAFARRQPISPCPVDLNERIRSSQPMLSRLLGSDVKLVLELQDGLGRVRLDPSQLDQLLVNFVSNARDALPEGGHLWIRTADTVVEPSDLQAALVPPGDYVRMEVEDDGPGMSPEVAEKVFDPFFTTKEVGRGTGLGLATVHGIVKQAGGYIKVDARPGRGARFDLLLPRYKGEVANAAAEAMEPVKAPGNERILVVEDDQAVRARTVRTLTDAGYQVHVAGSGTEALELASALASPDLLLTDIVMPELDGRRLALKLLAQWPRLRVLYVSGHVSNRIPGGLSTDMDYLQKPFSRSTLLKRVRAALDRRTGS
jgi:PAS domain S-box-containing protein